VVSALQPPLFEAHSSTSEIHQSDVIDAAKN